ncbi:Hypothetical_protein [Hexamita inflata]|uniref:Hypothetical_protein n=1 Tax=Hexamita inflata TaxID=28002 RepID=A0AA86P794_9EUKA|nr:Hypothetical protein HINF_LOCUS20929 [Hexamita inflata]
MPTQQGPNRALTESSADQFYLIRQLNFQKLVLASQFLFARYFLRLAREVVPLYWHCLVVVAFDALVHQLDQVPVYIYIFTLYNMIKQHTPQDKVKQLLDIKKMLNHSQNQIHQCCYINQEAQALRFKQR